MRARVGYVLVGLVVLWDAATSIFFGVGALLTPNKLSGAPADVDLGIFPAFFAARSLPWAAALLLLLSTRSFRALVPLLALGSAFQAFDATLGVVLHRPALFVIGPSIKGLCLLASAIWVWRKVP